MGKATENAYVAYGDKGVRMVGEPPFYMLGASIIEIDSVSELKRIFSTMPGGAKKAPLA